MHAKITQVQQNTFNQDNRLDQIGSIVFVQHHLSMFPIRVLLLAFCVRTIDSRNEKFIARIKKKKKEKRENRRKSVFAYKFQMIDVLIEI